MQKHTQSPFHPFPAKSRFVFVYLGELHLFVCMIFQFFYELDQCCSYEILKEGPKIK